MNISKSKWSQIFLFPRAWLLFSVIIISLIGTTYLGQMLPRLMAGLSRNYGIQQLFYQNLYSIAYLLLGVFVFRISYQLVINKYVQLLVQNVRIRCFEKWVRGQDLLGVGFRDHSDRFPMGEVIARIMNDTLAVRELATSGTFAILIDIFFVLSCLAGFVRLNSRSGLFLSIFEILASIVLLWGSRYMRKIFHEVRSKRGMVSRQVANCVGGVREVYFHPNENYASKSGEKVYNEFLDSQLVANIWDASYYSVAESLYPILLAFVVLVFPYSQITEAAVIFAIVDLIQRSISPIKNIAGKIANIQRAASGISRINDFTNAIVELDDLAVHSSGLTSRYSVENVKVKIQKFAYPKRSKVNNGENTPEFTLRNIKFEAKRGETIGIVGASGSGKSTLLGILNGTYLPEKGEIKVKCFGSKESLGFGLNYLDGYQTYRQLVSLVAQDGHIFSASLVFNITFEEEITEGLRHFWHWVSEKIPYISKWGVELEDDIHPGELSLGQKQLLCALRASYFHRPLVLFDEISSGLDNELEEALRIAFKLLQKEGITFIVAHRLETVVKSDKIIVIQDGVQADMGTHAELMGRSAAYQDFIREISDGDGRGMHH